MEAWNEKIVSVVSVQIVFIVAVLQAFWYAIKFILWPADAAESEREANECAICFEKMITSYAPFPSYIVGHFHGSKRLIFFSRTIPEIESNHLFHESCLDAYFSGIALDQPLKCPLCRISLEDVREHTLELFLQLAFPASADVPSLEQIIRLKRTKADALMEQFFVSCLCSRNTALFMQNLPYFQDKFGDFPHFFRYLFRIFDFDYADLSSLAACKLDFQQKFLRESFNQGQLDLFCTLFDFFPTANADAFLCEIICKQIESCSNEEYKLILLFERLNEKKKSQMQEKLYRLGVKAKNLSFLSKFLMFYDNYPDGFEKILKPLFASRELIVSLLEKDAEKTFSLYFIYCTRQQNAQTNTLMLIEGLKAKAFPQVYRFIQNPSICSFDEEKEKIMDQIALLLIQNPDFALSHRILQEMQQKNCLYSVKKSTCIIL